jgi:hypothetical protein
MGISGDGDGTHASHMPPPHGRYAWFAMPAMFGATATDRGWLLIGQVCISGSAPTFLMRIFAAELCGNRSGGAKVRLQHLLRSASNPLHYSLAQKVRIRNVFPFSTSQGFKFEPLLPPGFFCATYLGINMCVLLNAPSPPTPCFRSLQNLRLQRDPTNIGVLREYAILDRRMEHYFMECT